MPRGTSLKVSHPPETSTPVSRAGARIGVKIGRYSPCVGMRASIDRTGRTLCGAACLWAAGCASSTPAGPPPGEPSNAPSRLVTRLFEPGPSEDRFDSDLGPVIRVRTAPDQTGSWASTTAGPDETSVLTLRRDTDGSVRLLSLVSGDRDVVCEPGLVIEPGDAALPHAAEGPCTIDGRRGVARVSLHELIEPGERPVDPDERWVRLTLGFEAFPVTASRTFDWKARADQGIVEERAVLEVRVLGVTVRSRSRAMTRSP